MHFGLVPEIGHLSQSDCATRRCDSVPRRFRIPHRPTPSDSVRSLGCSQQLVQHSPQVTPVRPVRSRWSVGPSWMNLFGPSRMVHPVDGWMEKRMLNENSAGVLECNTHTVRVMTNLHHDVVTPIGTLHEQRLASPRHWNIINIICLKNAQ